MSIPANAVESQTSTLADAGARTVRSVSELKASVAEAGKKLDQITEGVQRGEPVGQATRDWMFEQMDLVLEAIGDENLELNDQLRSEMLQLMLSVANLNEHIRRQDSLRGSAR
jgi:uncharacterized protein YfaS (alpha-2-macroglobulin family)